MLFRSQHYGIKVTMKETLSIKLADGLYDESSEFYLKVFDVKKSIKSRLPHIIHFADHMATLAEADEWKRGDEDEKEEMESRIENIKSLRISRGS